EAECNEYDVVSRQRVMDRDLKVRNHAEKLAECTHGHRASAEHGHERSFEHHVGMEQPAQLIRVARAPRRGEPVDERRVRNGRQHDQPITARSCAASTKVSLRATSPSGDSSTTSRQWSRISWSVERPSTCRGTVAVNVQSRIQWRGPRTTRWVMN